MLSLLLQWISILTFSLLLTMSGWVLYRLNVAGAKNHPLTLQFGSGFYLGLTLFLVLLKLLNFRFAGWLALEVWGLSAAMLLLLVRQRELLKTGWQKLRKALDRKSVGQLIAALLAVHLLALLGQGVPAAIESTTLLQMEQIISAQQWLVFGQSSSDAMLWALPILWELPEGAWAGALWLIPMLTAGGAMLFGLLRWFGLKQQRQWMGLAVVMGGQASWSLLPIQLFPHGSSLYGLAHGASWMALGSLLILLLYFNGLQRDGEQVRTAQLWLPAAMVLFWSFAATQLLLLVLPGLLGFVLWARWRYRWSWQQPLLWSAVMAIAMLLGIAQGGLFTPASWHATPLSSPALELRSGWSPVVVQSSLLHTPPPEVETQGRAVAGGDINYLEQQAWLGVRALFFPLVGMILMAVWVMTGQEHALGPPPEGRVLGAREGPFTAVALSLFLTTFLAVLLLDLDAGGPKWGVSDWLMPTVVLGLLFLVVGLKRFLAGLNGWHRELMWGLLLTATLWGPVIHLLAGGGG
uniref:Uncharacterized protein n=1 Tax=Magnetococcus massalia (strain MO-1) TaxID=451514 RepID=A0A1S7LCJ3_MAGMO|nr:conserved membrane protein of unknown function [Candidatus Magnetococcus massalia]